MSNNPHWLSYLQFFIAILIIIFVHLSTYKDLCARIAGFIKEYNPKYSYPHSLSSTIIEMAHSQKFYMYNLPSLTDFGEAIDEIKLVSFLENLVFSSIKM